MSYCKKIISMESNTPKRKTTVLTSNYEEDSASLLLNYVSGHLRKLYISHIPLDNVRELPDFYKFYLGSIAYLIMFGIFFYFTYTSYEIAVKQPFLSLQTGPYCSIITVKVTGTYTADSYGRWIGQANFDYTQAPYEISMSFVSQGDVQYQSSMALFEAETISMSSLAVQQNLPLNLLYWISYRKIDPQPDGSVISFQYTGTAAESFNLQYVHGQVGSIGGSCPLLPVSTYDSANAVITMQYSFKKYSQQALCLGAVNPYPLGFFPTVFGDEFFINLDVNSFTTAVSVNLGILEMDALQAVPGNDYTYDLNGLINITFAEYFDPRSPAMVPIICIQDVVLLVPLSALPSSAQALFLRLQQDSLCFLQYGGTAMLPVFNHYGSESLKPSYCSCETGVGLRPACQEFNFMSSLLFFNLPGSQTLTSFSDIAKNTAYEVGMLLSLYNSTSSYAQLNYNAYNASWLASSTVYPNASDVTNNAQWRQSAFDFCGVSTPAGMQYCSVVSFNSFSPLGRGVSLYKYQLTKASCTNTFTIPSSSWTKLIDNPPVAFQQPYYECTQDSIGALINAAGIAQGNVATVLPFVVIVFLPILYLFLNSSGQAPPKQEYTFDEKTLALEAFALQLLRLRDGKVRGMKSKGFLLGLGRELMAAAKLEGGYPDSDDSSGESVDSDDEDEDDDEEGGGEGGGGGSGDVPAGGSIEGGQERSSESMRSSPTSKAQRRPSRRASATDQHQQHQDHKTHHKHHKKADIAPEAYARAGTKPTNLDVFVRKETKEKAEKVREKVTWSDSSHSQPSVFETARASFFNRQNNPMHRDVEMGRVTGAPNTTTVLNDASVNGDLPSELLSSSECQAFKRSGLPAASRTLLVAFTEAMQNETTASFRKARAFAVCLRQIHFDEDDDIEDVSVFVNLCSALSLHICHSLHCSLAEVRPRFGDSIAYNIGGTVFTVNKLVALSNS